MIAMLELRTSSNTNKKSNKLEEKSKKTVVKSENENSDDLKNLYNENSINKMDNYMNYSEQKTPNYPISRTTTTNAINGGSMESVNDGTYNSKCATTLNDYENIKQINENSHTNSEHNECNDYEKLDDKNRKTVKCKNNEDCENVDFESPKLELELNEKGNNNENDLENENEIVEELQNEKNGDSKFDINYKNEDNNVYIKEESPLLYDMENLYKKNDCPSDFNENNLSDSNNNNINNSNNANTYLDKICEDEESKEKYDENFINCNNPCGYKDEVKQEDPLFKEENETENNMSKLNDDANLSDENNVKLKNSLIKELLTKKNSKEQGNDQNKTFSLIDNLLNLKNDERLNNQLNKYLNEEKNSLENNKKVNDALLENSSYDNLNCFIDTTSNKESTNKNENLMKLKIICLSYLRILKRLTSSWSETDKAFEYHFVNLLNNVNSNNLDNYLCCFSNIKICFIKNVFLDSIIECIEELEIIKKFKTSEKKEDTCEKGIVDKNEFHKQILEEVENNLTKEIIEEIFQLTLKNPYCNNKYLNNINSSDGEHNTLSVFNGSTKNNTYNSSNTLFDLKKEKDYLNCSSRNICNSLGNCTANQSSHTCSSHRNHSCSATMPLNCANSFPFNCINNNVGNSSSNINNNKSNLINNNNTNSNNTNYNNYSIGSNICKKKCNYSDENILNKLNVSIDYNSYNDFNNNYIQEAEKVVEKYKNLSKLNSKDSENMYNSCSHSNLQDINSNNLNAYLQLKMFISEYENLCKNDKIKLKDLDLNANDFNFLKCMYAHLNSSNTLEEKGISDLYNTENDSKESKKSYYDSKLKLECPSNNDLNKLIPNYKLNEDENYEDRENYSKYERDQGLLNANDSNLNYLSNSFQNILRKRKIYDNYLSKCNNSTNMNNNSCYDLNYLLCNTNILKKLKYNLLENKKNGHNNDFRKKDSDLSVDDSSSHLNSRKSCVYKNNILNNLKNFKEMLNLSQESINKKGSYKNSTDHINSSTLYDFLLNTNNSSNIRENSLQNNNITNNISSNNSSVNNSNNNSNNNHNLNNSYNINSSSIQKKNSYDYNPDYNSKISANGSDLSLNNQENNDGILNNGKVESNINFKNKNDINKNIAMNNKNGKNVKNASSSPVSTNYGIGKLKYEMPVGVNPNDDKVKGVYFSKSPRGVGKWNAYFQIANNKRLFTSFSVSKYGYNEARKLSILKRTEWEKEYKHHTDLKNSDSKKGKKKSHVATSNLLRSNVKNISKGNSNNSNSDVSLSYTKDNQIKEDCLLYSNDEEGLISNKINTDVPSDLNDQQSSNKKINKLNMGNNGYIKVEDNINFFIECAKNENESFNSVDLLRSSLTGDKNNSKKNSLNYTQNSINNSFNNVIDNKHPLNSSRILSNSLGLSNKYIRNLHFPTIDSHAVSNFLEAVTDDQKISS